MEYVFQFPLSRGCTLALYEEQAFWDTFFISICQDGVLSGIHMRNKHFGMPFSIPPIKRVYSLPLNGEQAFWNTFFNYPYQEGVLSGNHMRNRHFGMRFSIPPIKGLYSLAIYLGTGIFENLSQLSLSRGCTLWHSNEQQAFWDTFFNSPYQLSVLWHYMRNRHFGIPFSFPSVKRVYSLAFI